MSDMSIDFLTSDRIFQSSDLKKDRALLDAARGGLARLRDTDGTGLVMLTEARLKQLAENERREHLLAETAAEVWRVMLLTRTLGEGERLTTVKLGRWTWLSRVDADDVAEFVEEMANALISGWLPTPGASTRTTTLKCAAPRSTQAMTSPPCPPPRRRRERSAGVPAARSCPAAGRSPG